MKKYSVNRVSDLQLEWTIKPILSSSLIKCLVFKFFKESLAMVNKRFKFIEWDLIDMWHK